jgi:hypothetical protein
LCTQTLGTTTAAVSSPQPLAAEQQQQQEIRRQFTTPLQWSGLWTNRSLTGVPTSTTTTTTIADDVPTPLSSEQLQQYTIPTHVFGLSGVKGGESGGVRNVWRRSFDVVPIAATTHKEDEDATHQQSATEVSEFPAPTAPPLYPDLREVDDDE